MATDTQENSSSNITQTLVMYISKELKENQQGALSKVLLNWGIDKEHCLFLGQLTKQSTDFHILPRKMWKDLQDPLEYDSFWTKGPLPPLPGVSSQQVLTGTCHHSFFCWMRSNSFSVRFQFSEKGGGALGQHAGMV